MKWRFDARTGLIALLGLAASFPASAWSGDLPAVAREAIPILRAAALAIGEGRYFGRDRERSAATLERLVVELDARLELRLESKKVERLARSTARSEREFPVDAASPEAGRRLAQQLTALAEALAEEFSDAPVRIVDRGGESPAPSIQIAEIENASQAVASAQDAGAAAIARPAQFWDGVRDGAAAGGSEPSRRRVRAQVKPKNSREDIQVPSPFIDGDASRIAACADALSDYPALRRMCAWDPVDAGNLAGFADAIRAQFGSLHAIETAVGFVLVGAVLALAAEFGAIAAALASAVFASVAAVSLYQVLVALWRALLRQCRAPWGSPEQLRAAREFGRAIGTAVAVMVMSLAGWRLGGAWATAAGARSGGGAIHASAVRPAPSPGSMALSTRGLSFPGTGAEKLRPVVESAKRLFADFRRASPTMFRDHQVASVEQDGRSERRP